MKVLFCGYRDWAIDVYFNLDSMIDNDDVSLDHVTSPDDLTRKTNETHYDLILTAGWSWMIEKHIIDNSIVLGMHPSNLPDYAGGSPIQNQIIDGLKTSFATLFRLMPNKFDNGPIIAKLPISLEGHIDDIFNELEKTTTTLFMLAIEKYPALDGTEQPPGGFVRKRIKPEASRLSRAHFTVFTCEQIYDRIRCREDPYPNTYIEDETGRLYFRRVEFVKKEDL